MSINNSVRTPKDGDRRSHVYEKRQKQLAEINARRAKNNSPAGSVKRLDDPLVRDRIAEADSYRVINHCESTS